MTQELDTYPEEGTVLDAEQIDDNISLSPEAINLADMAGVQMEINRQKALEFRNSLRKVMTAHLNHMGNEAKLQQAAVDDSLPHTITLQLPLPVAVEIMLDLKFAYDNIPSGLLETYGQRAN